MQFHIILATILSSAYFVIQQMRPRKKNIDPKKHFMNLSYTFLAFAFLFVCVGYSMIYATTPEQVTPHVIIGIYLTIIAYVVINSQIISLITQLRKGKRV